MRAILVMNRMSQALPASLVKNRKRFCIRRAFFFAVRERRFAIASYSILNEYNAEHMLNISKYLINTQERMYKNDFTAIFKRFKIEQSNN